MSHRWYLLESRPRSSPENMALDEALLQSAPRLGRPVLRFYGWPEAAATFGYSQRYSDVARMTVLRPLIRRPTGGGLVCHDADWTYALAFPPSHDWYALKASASYQMVHSWIREAFARCDIATELSACSSKAALGQCFIGAELSDLLWNGRKIAGAAQRRTNSGLLIQGSIRPESAGLARVEWQKAFCDAAVLQWGVEWVPLEISPALEEQIDQLANEKYSRLEYNQRR